MMGKRKPDKHVSARPDPGSLLPAEQRDAILEAVAEFRETRGNLLPVLHAVQLRLGFIPKKGIALIASELNRSRAEVHGVISFYHDFRTEPPGKHVLKYCRAEACQAVGARGLEQHLRATLEILPENSTTQDGSLTVAPTYCLGNCALGPAIMIDQTLHARVTPTRLDQLLEDL